MSALSSSIACLELRSLARGYQILNMITQNESLKVIEASAVDAQKFLILVSGEQATLAKALDEIARRAHGAILDFEFLATPHASLLPSIYSLMQGEVAESVLVVETESASRILNCAQMLLNEHELTLLEIKIGRGLRGQGLAFFTGTRDNVVNGKTAVQAVLKGMNRVGIAEAIEEPTKNFKAYFNLSGS